MGDKKKVENSSKLAMEAFYNAMAAYTNEELNQQKRVVLEVTPNKYSRYILKKS
jgi:hypothetical protein